MIKIKNLTFSYNDNILVLNDISLKIDKQETTALLGHNGAGKTTLFKCILGILSPDSGSVEISIENRDACAEKIISYMPESGGFYPLISPMENLVFRSRFYKSNIKSLELSKYWLEKLEINESKVKLAGNLSQGMQKRLSIACALINNPDILLLDEPTNGLDPESKDMIIDLIKETNEKDTTVVISTHDLNLASKLCNKLLLLKNGLLIKEENVKNIAGTIHDYYFETLKENNDKFGDQNV